MTTIDRIFFLLHERDVSQLAFAKAIGVSSGNISDWKSGRSSPKQDALVKIADYFNVSTDYLLGRTEEKSPSTTEAAPGDRHISLEESNRLLAALGLIQDGRELSDDDLAFLDHVVGLLEAWFSKGH